MEIVKFGPKKSEILEIRELEKSTKLEKWSKLMPLRAFHPPLGYEWKAQKEFGTFKMVDLRSGMDQLGTTGGQHSFYCRT